MTDVSRETYVSNFTPREQQVLDRLVGFRETDKQIALAIGCKPRTVQQHMRSIRLKAGVRKRGEIIEKLG